MLDHLTQLIPIVALVWTVWNTWYTHKVNRSRADRQELETLKTDMQTLRERVRVAENNLAAAPTRVELAEIHVGIEAIRGDMKGMTATLTGFQDLASVTRRQVELMDQYLRAAPPRPARS